MDKDIREDTMTEDIKILEGYFHCSDHNIYFPNTKQCCPACQVAIVESYLDRLIQVRDHYHKIGEEWKNPEGFHITQDMATQPGGTNHRTDIFKDQKPIKKEVEKEDENNGKE